MNTAPDAAAEKRDPYEQCICPKHGATTWLHADKEKDDFCLLPAARVEAKP